MRTMLGLTLMGAAIAASIALPRAIARSDDPRPEGVAADHWVALGSDAGFVVTGRRMAIPRSGVAREALDGFFVARHDGGWVRLDSEAVERVLPVR